MSCFSSFAASILVTSIGELFANLFTPDVMRRIFTAQSISECMVSGPVSIGGGSWSKFVVAGNPSQEVKFERRCVYCVVVLKEVSGRSLEDGLGSRRAVGH